MGSPGYITYEDSSGATQEIRFDAVELERPEFRLAATEHPVEEGVDVSDHVSRELERVGLDVFVTNQPTRADAHPSGAFVERELQVPVFTPPVTAGLFGAQRTISQRLFGSGPIKVKTLGFAEDMNRPRDLLDKLTDLQKSVTLVRYLSSVRDYADRGMLIESVSPVQDRGTGDGWRFSIELVELRTVRSETVVAPIPEQPRSKKKKNSGSKAAKPDENQNTVKRSALKEWFP